MKRCAREAFHSVGESPRGRTRELESPHFEKLTAEHVREVGEYRPIEIQGERFFERAWSRSKEAAATLGFALLLGADTVVEGLRQLERVGA